jgi:DNA polymerase-3 subunit beta
MEFLIQRDELIRALSRVQGIIEKRSATPILSAVLLQAREGGLRITAADKAMTFVGDFAAPVNVPGEVAVDAANAFSVARVLASDVVAVTLGDNHRLDLRCGKSYYKLAGQAPGDFPPTPGLETPGQLTMQAADLRRIIDQTWFSIAPDDNRYGLNGMHLETLDNDGNVDRSGGRVRAVSTDGSCLSRLDVGALVKGSLPRHTLIRRAVLASPSPRAWPPVPAPAPKSCEQVIGWPAP